MDLQKKRRELFDRVETEFFDYFSALQKEENKEELIHNLRTHFYHDMYSSFFELILEEDIIIEYFEGQKEILPMLYEYFINNEYNGTRHYSAKQVLRTFISIKKGQ